MVIFAYFLQKKPYGDSWYYPGHKSKFSLTELKNDRFRDVLPSKMVIFALFGQKRTHTLVTCS